jgi:hypothetical protein
MDATTSRGLDESGRGGCVLCLRQKAQILPSANPRVQHSFLSPGNAFGALIGGECEGTWLCFCFFTIAGRPKKESPYGHFGRGGDDLGELGAARPAERPKFRPDFGLGDPAMCVK